MERRKRNPARANIAPRPEGEAATASASIREGRRRQPAQRLLEESEQRYRSLFEYNPDAVFSLDRGPRFINANPAAERLSGYSTAELLQRSPRTLIAPEDLDRTLGKFRQALAGTPASDEITVINREGTPVQLNLTLMPIRVGGEITGVYGIAKDITERLRTEADRDELLLREQEARSRAEAAEGRAAFLADAGELLAASLDYATTLANLAELVVPGLADWCAIDMLSESGGLRRLVGAAEPGLRKRMGELLQDRPLPGRSDAATKRLMYVIRTGRPEFVPEVRPEMLTPRVMGGEASELLRGLEISSYMRVPLKAHGNVVGAISFVYAVSGRRYTEADLSLALELARRAALAVDNARLYQDAQRAIELRDQFLAAASHDLRTPVTSIKAFAQLLKRTVSRAAQASEGGGAGETASLNLRPAALLEGLQSIEDGASRITAQIDELLDLSRLQAGRPLELHRLPTELVGLVRRAADSYQQLSDRHRVSVEAQEANMTGMWDRVRLERVVGNLLSNAVKYSPEGGEIRVAVRLDGGAAAAEAVLTVDDQGIGIPATDLPHIFERFYRAGNVSGRPGTGIGLAGVRDIVQQHGGSIAVTSNEGTGTTFTVRLPLDAAEDDDSQQQDS